MKIKKMKKRPIVWLTIILVCLIPMQLGAQMVTGEKFVGNILGTFIPENYSVYWNQVTEENAGKWGSVESSRDNFNWTTLDSYYNYAKSNGYYFKHHCFVWGAQQPGWIGGASDQKAQVVEWITAYCERYPDTDYIDVVNEPLHNQPNYKNALGGDGATGWDWVIWTFEETRKHTNAKLLLNDYGILNSNTGTPDYLEIVNLLKDRGLIDGIGVQAHGYENVSINMLRDNLEVFVATGLPVYVSEYEIDTTNDALQLQRFQEQFPLFWEHPGVGGFTFWGYVQGHHWKPNAWLVNSGSMGASERPAITWLREYLSTTTPDPTPAGTLGDVNNDGNINIVDALLIAQYYVNLNPENFDSTNADVDCDGNIDIVDALLVAQYYVGLITDFC